MAGQIFSFEARSYGGRFLASFDRSCDTGPYGADSLRNSSLASLPGLLVQPAMIRRILLFTGHYRVPVLIAWLFCAGLTIWHQRIVVRYVEMVGELGSRTDGVVATPLSMPYTAFAADAQTWVRHALALLEGGETRLRFTRIDNAPDGREVHWNSGWAWCIALAGRLEQWMHGAPLLPSVERAALWLPSATLIVLSLSCCHFGLPDMAALLPGLSSSLLWSAVRGFSRVFSQDMSTITVF